MMENNFVITFIEKQKVKLCIIGTYILFLLCMLWIPQLGQYGNDNSQALNIIIFPEVVSVEILREFTKETGIIIYPKHVESDAELCVYLNNQNTSYDAVCIPEYLIPELKRIDKIESIDTSLLSNYKDIHPIFKAEEKNQDSVPFSWALFGLGVDSKTYPNLTNPSWSILFEKLNHKICVSDDPRSLILMGALALNYQTDLLSRKQINAIAAILKKQKPHVEIYTDTNIALLFANDIVPLAFTSYKALALANKYNPHAKFIIPKEGGIRIAQSWIIPKNSLKLDAAHKFINFMISPKATIITEESTEFLPTDNKLLCNFWTQEEQTENPCPLPPEDVVRAAHKAPQNISPKLLSTLWITLKNT